MNLLKPILACSLFALAASAAVAADSASLTGQWKLHSSIMGHESDQECTFTQKDAAITGTCKSDRGTVEVTGTVDGKKVTLKYATDYNGMDITLAFTGALNNAGAIEGDVEVQPMGVGGSFTATPAAAAPVAAK